MALPGGCRRCRVIQCGWRRIAERAGIQRRQRSGLSGQHHHQQCDEEIDLHPPQRKAGDCSELTALCRLPPVVDEDAQKRKVDDAGTDQTSHSTP